jgi:hypothetical protein
MKDGGAERERPVQAVDMGQERRLAGLEVPTKSPRTRLRAQGQVSLSLVTLLHGER